MVAAVAGGGRVGGGMFVFIPNDIGDDETFAGVVVSFVFKKRV